MDERLRNAAEAAIFSMAVEHISLLIKKWGRWFWNEVCCCEVWLAEKEHIWWVKR